MRKWMPGPNSPATLPAIWAFASSDSFYEEVRRIDDSVKPSNNVFLKIAFDLAHWQQVAAKEYPHGLPEPYSDDPTQGICPGPPAARDHAVQPAGDSPRYGEGLADAFDVGAI